MLEGEVIKNAVLQVVSVKSNRAVERIYISDGNWQYTFAMIIDVHGSIVENSIKK